MTDSEKDEIGPQCHRRIQVKRVRSNGWTKARRAAFLAELAQSCNVGRALVVAGMSGSTAYQLRRRDPEFAAQWQAALEIGYERLETALLRRALEAAGAVEIDDAAEPVEKMTVEQAIGFLNKHRASIQLGHAKARRSQAREVATQQEVDAILIRRIRMVKRQRRQLTGDAGGQAALPPPRAGDGAPDGGA